MAMKMMTNQLIYNLTSIGKVLSNDNVVINLFLPNFPLIKGSEPIFKINKVNTYKGIEYLIKGIHLIEELYKKETKNNFGFGSPSPTFKLIEIYSKSNFTKATELEYWIAKNGGNYHIKSYTDNNFKSRLKIHLKIRKAYNYYYAVIDNLDLKRLIYTNELFNDFVECIIPNKTDIPNYLTQANSNVLSNKSGVLITKDMLRMLIEKQAILSDFDTFYFYQLFNTMNDIDRYKKEYPSHYEIDKLNKLHRLEEQVFFENSEWRNILISNPDLFITKQKNKILIASKDYKTLTNIS